jgi:hypothetical protein
MAIMHACLAEGMGFKGDDIPPRPLYNFDFCNLPFNSREININRDPFTDTLLGIAAGSGIV